MLTNKLCIGLFGFGVVGKGWAQYLVDKKLVKDGDFIWMPVEVPGATYGVQEAAGAATVLKPMNISTASCLPVAHMAHPESMAPPMAITCNARPTQ